MADPFDKIPEPSSSAFSRQPLEDGPLAEYVADKLRDQWCRVPGLGWLQDTGAVWRERTDDALVETCRIILKQLAHLGVEDAAADGARIKSIAVLLGAGKMRAVSGLLKGILEEPASDFDTAGDFLNTPSGVVDLRTGEFAPKELGDKFTKITWGEYRPGATSRDWQKALKALPPESRAWLQVRLGQAITGHMTSDDKLIVLKGAGANGKSTIVDAVQNALGDFAAIIPDRVLIANPGDHPTELTMLRGLRVAFMEELPEGGRFNGKRLKDTLGTPVMTARKIAKDNITWNSTHSMFLTTNYHPKVTETDLGTWRRLAMLVFPYTFRAPRQRLRGPGDRAGDAQLRSRVRRKTTQRAVLAWLVEGAVEWYRLGEQFPPEPARVVRDTLAWRKQTDLVLAFVDDELVFDPDSSILASDLHEQFSRWLGQGGHPEWSVQTITARFSEHTEITDHQVRKLRMRVDNRAVSTPLEAPRGPRVVHAPAQPTSGNLHVWRGLRWRHDEPRTGGTG